VTAPVDRAGQRRRVAALAGGALGLAAAIAMAAFAARAHGPRASSLDASLVAVAPFDAVDPALGLWRQGVVDVLARQLDGAGPLRTVSPTVVVRRFAGHSDAASARALAERTNAGLVVYGGLVRAGADSVRLDATLLDARRGRTLGEVRVRGPLARMDRVLDSLSVGLLRELARTRPVGAVRASGVASVPFPALEAFLAAEQHYRAGAYDSATAEAERAVALDSTFALAWHRLGALVQLGGDDQAGARHLLRAGQLNRGLAPRDSIIVALDSVRGAGDMAGDPAGPLAPRDGVPTGLETYLSRVRQGTRLYPDDPELWYTLGEGLTHVGALEGATRADQIAAYERAIALDSAFLPAYLHAVGALLASGNVARARHHLQTVRALARGERLRSAADVVLRVVRPDGAADTAAFDAWLQAAPLPDFEPVWALLDDWPDSTEMALRLLRVARRRAQVERPGMLAIVAPRLHSTLGYRGHLAEQRAAGATPVLLLQHAILGALPEDSARVAAAAWLRGGLPELSRPEPLVWFALRGDSVPLTRYVRRVESEFARLDAGPTAQSGVAQRARYGVGTARAYLRLARRDTVGALAELRELPERDCPADCTANHLLRARLLGATGALSEARAILYRGSPAEGGSPGSAFDVLWQYERARAAEQAEDLDRALTAYATVAGTWARADRVLDRWRRDAKGGHRRVQEWMDARGLRR
jgi:eukaryotic-like serine/threonine-protein kinase